MNAKTETSLMLALTDLRQIEEDRLAEEAAQRAAEIHREALVRQQKEEQQLRAAQQRIAEEAQLQRLAEAEARLRSSELRHSEELAQRSQKLEHELRVTSNERSLLLAQLGSIEDEVSVVSQRWRWRLVSAVGSSLVMALLGVVLMGPRLRRIPPPPVVSTPRAEPSPAELQRRIETEVQRRVKTMEQQLVTLRQATESLSPAGTTRPPIRRPNSSSAQPLVQTNLSDTAAGCQDDPLCGIGGKRESPSARLPHQRKVLAQR